VQAVDGLISGHIIIVNVQQTCTHGHYTFSQKGSPTLSIVTQSRISRC